MDIGALDTTEAGIFGFVAKSLERSGLVPTGIGGGKLETPFVRVPLGIDGGGPDRSTGVTVGIFIGGSFLAVLATVSREGRLGTSRPLGLCGSSGIFRDVISGMGSTLVDFAPFNGIRPLVFSFSCSDLFGGSGGSDAGSKTGARTLEPSIEGAIEFAVREVPFESAETVERVETTEDNDSWDS